MLCPGADDQRLIAMTRRGCGGGGPAPAETFRRHCEEPKATWQSICLSQRWIASSLALLAMTRRGVDADQNRIITPAVPRTTLVRAPKSARVLR